MGGAGDGVGAEETVTEDLLEGGEEVGAFAGGVAVTDPGVAPVRRDVVRDVEDAGAGERGVGVAVGADDDL
jgi:hypothetical protein